MSRIVFPYLPKSWRLARLGQVARIRYGKALLSSNREETGNYEVYGSGGLVGNHDEYLHSGPSIIVGRKGSVGSIYSVNRPFWCIDTAFYLDEVAAVVNLEYLSYLLRALDLKRLSITVGVPGLNREELESIEIPVPPLPEQQRIVAILRQADDLCQLRLAALTQAQKLTSALFLEMFGDPINNPKGYKKIPLGELGQLDRGVSKNRPRDAAFLFGGEYPFIQTGDVTNSGGWITRYSQTYSVAGLSQSRLWPAGTLCITIAANIAKTGILTFDACFPDSVVGFVPNEQVTAEYVMFAINLFQKMLESQAPQAAQKNINLQILNALRIPLPPKDKQEVFSQQINEIRMCCQRLKESDDTLNDLFTILQATSFTGDLTTSWRETHRRELKVAERTRDNVLGKTKNIVNIQEEAPEERRWQMQVDRGWIMDQMSELQRCAWKGLHESKVTMIPSKNLAVFAERWSLEHFESTHEQILRALNQLAGLGLIAKISVSNQEGEYWISNRGFRAEEFSRIIDIQALKGRRD